MFFSWPSGNPRVVSARKAIQSSEIFEAELATVDLFEPEVVHVSVEELFPPLAQNEVYVGNGVAGCQYFIASRWATPCVAAAGGVARNSLARFRNYAQSRMDRSQWLRPLIGKRMVCDCEGKFCHTEVLEEMVKEELDTQWQKH